MPYCPNCRTEYRQGFIHCNDCGASLVSELPELPEMEEPGQELRLVKLTEFLTPTEAGMVKELLEENGIPVLVRGQSDPLSIVSGAQPVALLVAESDLERATIIYEAFFDQFNQEDDELLPEE
ncbi:MAG: DUF2007 domain-containing protein [Acidobacteria bacterium]|nr:DUF2007 domain-containing protein [Acidobacteriota bacterium]